MRPRLLPLLLALFALTAAPAAAQDYPAGTPEAEVMAVVTHLFDGMRAGDSTAVRSVFADGATLGRVASRDGVTGLMQNDLNRFVTMVGTPHDEVFDERLWDPTVLVDGDMAMAWTPYAFYLGDQLSHCGTNVFQLYRTADGWKVFNLVDTARRADCDIPEHVRK